MKQNINYYKLTVHGCLWAVTALFLSSCVKSRAGGEDFSGLKTTVLIPEGGLSTFSSQALTFPAADLVDTASFHVNYAATNVAPADETITLAIDPTALATYNSTSTIQYEAFPDSIFSFTATSVTVKKGNNYTDAIPVAVYPSKVDPSKNYMLPISIKTVPSGATISANYQTIYYHLIGNPIAGAYNEHIIRYNNSDGTGTPAYDLNFDNVFSPSSPTEIQVQSQFNGLVFIIDFENSGGTLSNFTATIDPASYGNAGLASITSGPTIVADPIAKTYVINFAYLNTGAAGRNITETFTKQ